MRSFLIKIFGEFRMAKVGILMGSKSDFDVVIPAVTVLKKFGVETVKILDLYPKRLEEVPKIGRNKAARIARVWKETHHRRDDMIFLEGLGITPAYCARLFKRYGDAAVAAVRDAVVEISTTTVSNRGQLTAGAGSGVIIHGDGIIVTNNHVIEGASSIYVRLTNGNRKALLWS